MCWSISIVYREEVQISRKMPHLHLSLMGINGIKWCKTASSSTLGFKKCLLHSGEKNGDKELLSKSSTSPQKRRTAFQSCCNKKNHTGDLILPFSAVCSQSSTGSSSWLSRNTMRKGRSFGARRNIWAVAEEDEGGEEGEEEEEADTDPGQGLDPRLSAMKRPTIWTDKSRLDLIIDRDAFFSSNQNNWRHEWTWTCASHPVCLHYKSCLIFWTC